MPNLSVTTAAEVAFAQRFLGALHANSNNVYLLLAVIAWMRAGGRVVGNNPLGLAPGPDDLRFRSGQRVLGRTTMIRRSRGKRIRVTVTRYASTYRNLTVAAMASANRLLRTATGYNGYGLIVRSAQRRAQETAADQQAQGLDFLAAIALSNWDKNHYGTTGAGGSYDVARNQLVQIWASLLGHPVNLPQAATPAPPVTVTPPAPPAAPVPREPDKLHKVPLRDYIEPYAAQAFYETRRHGLPTLPGEAGVTTVVS
jgi:hypothetical protein